MSKQTHSILFIILSLLFASLACRIAVDYDGDGVIPGMNTSTPTNKADEIDNDKPTAFVDFTSTPTCYYDAEIHEMFSVPEGFMIPANSDFLMVWQIENTGCGNWQQGVYLQNISGGEIAKVLQIPMPTLAIGEYYTIEVPMTVKGLTNTSYQSVWQLTTPANQAFGPEFLSVIFIDQIPNSKNLDTDLQQIDEAIVIDAKPISGEIELVSGPDMIIQDVEVNSYNQNENTVEYLVTLLNQGVEDMNEFKIQCVNDENHKVEQVVSYVEKGQVARLTCTLPIETIDMESSVTVLIDYENAQLELDETNNIETYSFMTMTTTTTE